MSIGSHRGLLPGLASMALLTLAGAGCADDMPLPPDPGEAEVVVGGAEASGSGFVALDDGDEVELIPGAQGGYHVFVGMEMSGAMGTLYVDRDARREEDGTLVLRTNLQTLEVPEDAMEGWWQKPTAFTSFMCPSPIGVEVSDQPIEFRVALVDDDEVILGEDTLTLVPRCPEGELFEHCDRICSGQ